MLKKLPGLFLLFTFAFLLSSQAQSVGIGTNTPNASAQLDVSSTSKGFLPPRMTYVQRSTILSPAAGLMIYCTDCGLKGEWQGYNGSEWTNMTGGSTQAALSALVTTSVSSIAQTTAVSGGNVMSDGGASVTARGVVWSTSSNPTVALSTKSTDGTGTGSFTSNLSGLTPNTTYYVRAYATNSAGTSYGNEVSFKTNAAPPPSNVTDIDGNIYPTVTIGTQVWMAENLRTTKYRDGSAIPVVASAITWALNRDNSTPSPMMCWYNNDQSAYTANKMGALYNWYAINSATNGNKNVCPSGWHVPSDAEWNVLIDNLDPLYNPTAITQSTTAGSKMKSTGTIQQGNGLWEPPNTDATNSSGFSGLPGGLRNAANGSFFDIGGLGHWWTSTEKSTLEVWYRSLFCNSGEVRRMPTGKAPGLSVRCLKD
jgi:uncharacterized protein (TIGR02145 family)